jgi:pyruvate,water dikinase
VPTSNYIRWFSEIRLDDVGLVGGKNASLGQMYAALSTEGILVPNGFALTAAAYRDALTAAKAWEPLHRLLGKFDKRRVDLLAKRAAEARSIVYRAMGIEELRQQTIRAYRKLEADYGANVAVAVRSSATAEDLPSASFAGQHESFLTSAARMHCSTPAAAASPRSSPTARSPIASTTASITSRSASPSA